MLRRFYLEHGYADFQVLSADATSRTPTATTTSSSRSTRGRSTRSAPSTSTRRSRASIRGALTEVIKTKSGTLFNATDVETSVENLTIELSRLGYVFAQVRPRGDRDYTNHIDLAHLRHRRGPARLHRAHRDPRQHQDARLRHPPRVRYRRGRCLQPRADRQGRAAAAQPRLLQDRRDHHRSRARRPTSVVLVVNVEDQSTGSFSVAGGVSTTEGLIAEVSLEETNFLGRGQSVRVAVGGGQSDQTYNALVHRPVFPRLPHRRRLRRLPQRRQADDRRARSTNVRPAAASTLGLPLTDELARRPELQVRQRRPAPAAITAVVRRSPRSPGATSRTVRASPRRRAMR